MHINFLKATPTLDPVRAEEKLNYQFYWTEPAAIEAYADTLIAANRHHFNNALDLGCNDGRWIELFRRRCIQIDYSVGIDLRPVEECYCDTYMQIDVTKAIFEPTFDLVVSNPPFGNELHKFILKAFEAVNRENGLVTFFIPVTQLATGRNYTRIWSNYPPTRICTYSTRPHCERNKYGKPSSYPGREMMQVEWVFRDGFIQDALDMKLRPFEWITYERDSRLESINE